MPDPLPDHSEDGIELSVDGSPVQASAGQTLAAALTAAGRRTWNTSRRDGAPRGLYCGIGVCFGCLVVLNGRPNTRACLVRVKDGDVVTTQHGSGHDDLV